MIAYFIVEIAPGLFGSRTARNLQNSAVSTLDPGRELRRRRRALEEADTVDNRRLLAEAMEAAARHGTRGLWRAAIRAGTADGAETRRGQPALPAG
jgi:hypothetical protein